MSNTHFSLLGQSKSTIITHFGINNCVEFLHWLYVPRLGVVLSFDKQICFDIGKI